MIGRRRRRGVLPGLPSAEPGTAYSALEECNFVIDSISRKADQNKTRARLSAWTLTASTVSIPVLILVGAELGSDGFWPGLVGKILPAVLGASAAILGRWIRVEQPHQRWTLYRHWQRTFEAERLRYRQQIGEYADDDRDDRLAEMLAEGQIRLDEDWATLVPRSEAFVADVEATP